jgi:ABC-type transporter MlaC component
MKKYFFLFFLYFFSTYSFSDQEVVDYVNHQHDKIFNYLSENKSLLESDRKSFLDQFELRFSKLIPPEEISKRVMGK